jgi:hypothetical protein
MGQWSNVKLLVVAYPAVGLLLLGLFEPVGSFWIDWLMFVAKCYGILIAALVIVYALERMWIDQSFIEFLKNKWGEQ